MDTDSLKQSGESAKSIFHGIGNAAEAEGARIDVAITRAAKRVGAALLSTEIIKQIATIRGEFQQLEVAFKTLLQSEDKAKVLMSEMVTLAAKTPFDLKGVAHGARQLLAYGFAADDITGTLTRLGNVAAGLGLPLERLTYLYGTTMTQGRLYARDMMQFTTSGIPMLQEMAKMYGKSTDEINAMVSAGKIGFEDVKKVIENMTNSGGKFHNLMEEQSKTITGQISNLGDAIDVMFNDMGKSQEGVISGAISGATYLVENYEKVLDILTVLVATYGTYKATLMLVAATSKGYTIAQLAQYGALLMVEKAQKLLNATMLKNPYVIAAVAVVGLATALWALHDGTSAAEKAQKEYDEGKEKAIQLEADHKNKIDGLIQSATDENLATLTRTKSLQELKKEYPNIFAQYDIEKLKLADILAIKLQIAEIDAGKKVQSSKDKVIELQSQYDKAKADYDEFEARETTAWEAEHGGKQGEDYHIKRIESIGAKLKLAQKDVQEDVANDWISNVNKLSDKQLQAELVARKKLESSIDHNKRNGVNTRANVQGGTLPGSFSEEQIRAQTNVLEVELNKRGAKLYTYTELVQKYTQDFTQAQKDLADSKNNKKGLSEADLNKEIADKESKLDSAEKALKTLTGVSNKDTSKAADTAEKLQQEITDAQLKNALAAEKKRIDALADGRVKELAQIQLNKEAKLAAIDQEERELEEKYKKTGKSSERHKIGDQMSKEFGAGNVDLLARPLIDAAELVKKGWKDAGDGIATVFSSQYGVIDKQGKKHELLVTPILPNGDVLSQAELESYLYNALEGADDILKADKKGIVIGIDVLEDGSAGEKLHELQAQYYVDALNYADRRKTVDATAVIQTTQAEEKYAKEVEALYAQIGDVFLSEEERKRDGIAETYGQMRKELKAMLDGGNITGGDYLSALWGIEQGEQKATLDTMLSGIETYERQRLDVQEKYAKKRESLYEKDGKTLKEGVTQGNVDELGIKETDAVAAVDEQFAQREATYQVWMEKIADMTLIQLEAALTKAKEELKVAEASGTKDPKVLATANAKVNTAQAKVNKAKAKNDTSPGKRTIKEWEDLYKTLREVEQEFESIGDTVGGTAGEIIKTAGQIATSTLSMINGIVQLANWATLSTKMTAEGVAKSIQTVEKASVILTIISAAMQIAMTIINLFNNDKEHQEEIESLQGRIEQLQWELDNVEISRLKNNNVDILKNMRDIYAETTTEVMQLHATEITRWQQNTLLSAGFAESLAKAAYQNEILTASAGKLADFYSKVDYTANKALGGAKYTEAQDALKNLAQQQLLIQEQIQNEEAKKKTDHSQIAEWEQQIQELGAEAIEMINELVEEIIGGSSSEIAKDLGDAFIEAFQEGEDAAQAWGDKVNDIVADIMKQMLVSQFLEVPLGEVFNKYKKKWFGNGAFSLDTVIDSMGDFANDLMTEGDKFKDIWDNLPDNIKDLFKPADEDREASERGIATASQESVDENNGRLTAIQGHTYGIFESMKLLQPDVSSIRSMMGEMMGHASRQLMVMQGIETNTRSLVRLEQIETDMGAMKNTLNDINLKGLKIR